MASGRMWKTEFFGAVDEPFTVETVSTRRDRPPRNVRPPHWCRVIIYAFVADDMNMTRCCRELTRQHLTHLPQMWFTTDRRRRFQ